MCSCCSNSNLTAGLRLFRGGDDWNQFFTFTFENMKLNKTYWATKPSYYCILHLLWKRNEKIYIYCLFEMCFISAYHLLVAWYLISYKNVKSRSSLMKFRITHWGKMQSATPHEISNAIICRFGNWIDDFQICLTPSP